VADRKPQ